MTAAPTPAAPAPGVATTDRGRCLAPLGDALVEQLLLPASTVQTHAANLALLPGGDLACVWFGGTQEGVSDISVHLSRRGTDGRWSEPVQLSDDGTRSEQNPILFGAGGQVVWLLYTAQLAGNQDTAVVRRRVSPDGGSTWGDPEVLLDVTDRGGVFVRQPPVRLESGRLVLPVFNCVTVPGERWVGNADTSSVYVSDDDGASWREVVVPESLGCVHMNIVVREDGSLWACFRSRWADHVYETESTDAGQSWSVPRPMALPNNNSSVQAVATGGGSMAMVLNWASREDATERRASLYDEIDDDGVSETDGPVLAEPSLDHEGRTAFWGAPRAPMALALSTDDGRTWPDVRLVEDGDGYCLTNNSRDRLNRELSYPSIVVDPAGDLHLAYTWWRQGIEYVRVRPSLLPPAQGV